MKITLEIPDAKISKSKWMPKGVSIILVDQNPLVSFSSELKFSVRDEWIKKVEDDGNSLGQTRSQP